MLLIFSTERALLRQAAAREAPTGPLAPPIGSTRRPLNQKRGVHALSISLCGELIPIQFQNGLSKHNI